MVEELKKAGGDSWDVAEFRKELKAIVRLKSKLPELIYSGNKDKYEEIVQKINTEAAWANRRVKKILNTEEDYIKKTCTLGEGSAGIRIISKSYLFHKISDGFSSQK